ncbi:hypothetical protein MTO96_007810 [Rhipicephalus appendiculatus]
MVAARPVHCLDQTGELAETDEVLPAESAVVIQSVATPTPEPSFIDQLKRWIGQRIDESSPALTRKLLTADVSPQCSIGLLKMVRGLRNLEPWALRPTKSDFGAFDECLETEVKDSHGYVAARGQYCNLLYFGGNSSDLKNYIFPAMTVAHPRVGARFLEHALRVAIPFVFSFSSYPVGYNIRAQKKLSHTRLLDGVSLCEASSVVIIARVINNVIFAEKWTTMIVPAGFIGVDTFFFLSKPRCTVAIFSLLSIAGCAASTWHVAGNDTPPFIVVVDESVTNFFETMYFYYLYPHYHAACYFTGPIAFILLEGFRKRKISKITQLAGWCIAIACGLCCIFMKIGWYTTKYPTTEFGKLSTTFFDRLLWSIFMVWLTLACASGRGGFLSKFLSWGPFAPLARLAFGVYLIHMPFIQLALHISRERMMLSHFVLASFCFSTLAWSYILSYFLFISCEAPVGKLDKLVFEGLRRKSPKKEVEDKLPTNIEFVTEKQQIADHLAESNNNNNSETTPDEQQFGLQPNGVKPTADTASCRL